jgi:hypothetical protein
MIVSPREHDVRLVIGVRIEGEIGERNVGAMTLRPIPKLMSHEATDRYISESKMMC